MSGDFKDLFGDWRPDDEGGSLPESSFREAEYGGNRPLNEKEVKVVNVFEGRIDPLRPGAAGGTTTFVLLEDRSGRKFRIFVLRDVAVSISMALDNDVPDRPFTHDLMKNIMERVGVKVERVTIDDLWQETFYAKITIEYNGEVMDIDARPSDAIAMALRFRAPIYVAEAVLEAAQHDI